MSAAGLAGWLLVIGGMLAAGITLITTQAIIPWTLGAGVLVADAGMVLVAANDAWPAQWEAGMRAYDRRAWRACQGLGDIGRVTALWCEGLIRQTPAHMGPPCTETLPYLDILASLNRHGPMITTNSQAAEGYLHMGDVRAWNAWVQGACTAGTWRRLGRQCVSAGLCVEELHSRAADDECSFYADRCPAARSKLEAAVWLVIYDPEPGRNDRLWPVLKALAAWEEVPHG